MSPDAPVECCAGLFPVGGAWPVPVPSGWAEVRCLCGYESEPMPVAMAEQLRATHERGPTRRSAA